MSPVKRFLLILTLVYFALGTAILIFFGPPGLSSAYRQQYQDDHTRYLAVTKSQPYTLFEELKPMAGNGRKYSSVETLVDSLFAEHPEFTISKKEFIEGIEFVEAYEQRPAFHHEEVRREWFGILFDWLNTLGVAVLVVRFASKPLGDLLDRRVAAVHSKLQKSREGREQAAQRLTTAKSQVDGLDGVTARLRQEGEDEWREITAQIEEDTRRGIAQLDRDGETRKSEEENLAAKQLREDLVREAINVFAERYAQRRSPEQEAHLIDGFIAELEQKA